MIYFVRHGQTDWNLENKLQGRADISLNETGIRQANETKEKLLGIKFDKVFCSPLKRAKQTCEIITNVEIIFDDRIIEREFGEYEGFKREEFDFLGFWNSKANQKFKKAENIFDVEKRVFNFIEEILKKYPKQNILVVAHGGVGLLFSSYFKGKPENGDYMHYSTQNGEVLCFEN